jgi:hypothetical protein
MADGLLNTGVGYQRGALGGFSKLAGQESQLDAANKQIEEAGKQQAVSMVSTAAVIGTMIAMSDERLKNIVEPFTRGIESLKNVAPITFCYNELSGLDRSEQHSGFSAQNLLEMIPEAVLQNKDGYCSVDLFPIVAALVNAVNELKAEIDVLKLQREE